MENIQQLRKDFDYPSDPSILSDEEVEFLAHHKIFGYELFNAEGYSRGDYQESMRLYHRLFAFNTTPCRYKHRLRSRAGHCICCNAARIRYMRNPSKSGWVYIAYSTQGNCTKVGYTESEATYYKRADALPPIIWRGMEDK